MSADTALAPRPPPSPWKILLVEDAEDLSACVAEYLRSAGFEVVMTRDAPEALFALTSGGRLDLVFSDVNMPGAMDGVGLANWLSLHQPLLPLILTSAQRRSDLGRLPAHRLFVQKPYVLRTLEEEIRSMLELIATP